MLRCPRCGANQYLLVCLVDGRGVYYCTKCKYSPGERAAQTKEKEKPGEAPPGAGAAAKRRNELTCTGNA